MELGLSAAQTEQEHPERQQLVSVAPFKRPAPRRSRRVDAHCCSFAAPPSRCKTIGLSSG